MLFLLTAPLAAASTDTLGGSDVSNNDGDMLKLVAIDVDEAVAVTTVDFAVTGRDAAGDILFVLYEATGGGNYELVDAVPAVDTPATGTSWATTGDVTWVLEPGRTYAMGAWVSSDWTYYYSDSSRSPWFGTVTETYRVQETEQAPDRIRPDAEEYFYAMRIHSEDADLDDDGVISQDWGGADCDDDDATIAAATEEIPYDGVDQDCDGADLVDVDGDGSIAREAGGDDCDDTTGAVAPSREEICGDGVDNDCVHGDEECDTGVDPDAPGAGDRDALDISPDGCGCSTGTAAPGSVFASLLGALALVVPLRRRAAR
jgi:MYXO-CTERM domain-containing protein